MAAEKFGMYDARRVQMAALGWEVAMVTVGRESKQVTRVAYRFVGVDAPPAPFLPLPSDDLLPDAPLPHRE